MTAARYTFQTLTKRLAMLILSVFKIILGKKFRLDVPSDYSVHGNIIILTALPFSFAQPHKCILYPTLHWAFRQI